MGDRRDAGKDQQDENGLQHPSGLGLEPAPRTVAHRYSRQAADHLDPLRQPEDQDQAKPDHRDKLQEYRKPDDDPVRSSVGDFRKEIQNDPIRHSQDERKCSLRTAV